MRTKRDVQRRVWPKIPVRRQHRDAVWDKRRARRCLSSLGDAALDAVHFFSQKADAPLITVINLVECRRTAAQESRIRACDVEGHASTGRRCHRPVPSDVERAAARVPALSQCYASFRCQTLSTLLALSVPRSAIAPFDSNAGRWTSPRPTQTRVCKATTSTVTTVAQNRSARKHILVRRCPERHDRYLR